MGQQQPAGLGAGFVSAVVEDDVLTHREGPGVDARRQRGRGLAVVHTHGRQVGAQALLKVHPHGVGQRPARAQRGQVHVADADWAGRRRRARLHLPVHDRDRRARLAFGAVLFVQHIDRLLFRSAVGQRLHVVFVQAGLGRQEHILGVEVEAGPAVPRQGRVGAERHRQVVGDLAEAVLAAPHGVGEAPAADLGVELAGQAELQPRLGVELQLPGHVQAGGFVPLELGRSVQHRLVGRQACRAGDGELAAHTRHQRVQFGLDPGGHRQPSLGIHHQARAAVHGDECRVEIAQVQGLQLDHHVLQPARADGRVGTDVAAGVDHQTHANTGHRETHQGYGRRAETGQVVVGCVALGVLAEQLLVGQHQLAADKYPAVGLDDQLHLARQRAEAGAQVGAAKGREGVALTARQRLALVVHRGVGDAGSDAAFDEPVLDLEVALQQHRAVVVAELELGALQARQARRHVATGRHLPAAVALGHGDGDLGGLDTRHLLVDAQRAADDEALAVADRQRRGLQPRQVGHDLAQCAEHALRIAGLQAC